MRSKRERAERRLDRVIDRFADDVGYLELELLFQKHAQDLHEQWVDEADGDALTLGDVDLEGSV